MTSIKIREEIGQYLEHADERFLQLVYGLIKADQKAIAGYKPGGGSITKANLITRAEASEKDIKEGRVKSLKDLKKEIKGW